MADPLRPDPDLEWLDLVRPTGLVVAPSLLKELQLVPEQQTRADNAVVSELLRPDDEDGPALLDAWAFVERVLAWPASRVAGSPGGPALPDDLCKVLPEYDTVLEPHWAVAGVDGGWQSLVRVEAAGVKPDSRGALAGWEATPHQRFERLLRETEVPIGVLITDRELRLLYAPRGETSGWVSFPLRPLATTAGRPMLGGLKLLLDRFRLFTDAEERRLPAVLKASREAQTNVSTQLAEQVVGALHELLRGLTATEPGLIGTLARERPQDLYEGLLTVLMRLVFVLYAEDRDLIPSRTDEKARELYAESYSARGLHGKLLEDQARYPDTMEERRGAWGRLIALFRLIHAGDRTGWIRARGGKLFNPDAFPFLEGRASGDEPPRIVLMTDGCVLRILDGLLTLKGERLSYRTLDVEQIGSVYETVMGFTVVPASRPVLAIRAGKHNRTPVFVDLAELAALTPDERLKRLKEGAQRGSLGDRQQRAIRTAAGVDAIAAALDSIVDERGSPDRRIVQAGTPVLQPTPERRSTGSHYTPRSLTEPIVRHALEPIFERLGPDARPEQVLDLKICDPAMGSGAFLVEACRAIAARLVQAWARWPDMRPKLPPDEDEDLHARRLIAQRCLYGVDKNPMATDLAKLSLWLATLARDHEFTFLDHALKTGDSLVGLTRAQITALHWDASKPGLPLFKNLLRERFEAALAGRSEIRGAPDDVERAIQEARYQIIERRLSDARLLGDAVIAAFFSADKPRAREAKRQQIESWLNEPAEALWIKLRGLAGTLGRGEHPVLTFHWELEFPEVFARDNSGFDAIIGNPPFIGGSIFSGQGGSELLQWLLTNFDPAHGKSDLVSFFLRRAFALLRREGCFGLLATKSIRQGFSRETGLQFIIEHGGAIYHAIRRMKWPGDAAVVVAVVHVKRGNVQQAFLDGQFVTNITSFLLPFGPNERPPSLTANSMVVFSGINPNGEGFVLSKDEAEQLLATAPETGAFIFPYLSSVDLNGNCRAEAARFIIDVGCLSEQELKEHTELYDRLSHTVRRERAKSSEKRLREQWWRFSRPASKLYAQIRDLHRVLVMGRLATHHTFAFQPSGIRFSDAVSVFARDTFSFFAVVQSSSHELWAKFIGSAFKDDPRYIPEDCFETFAFPESFDTCPVLEAAGRSYYDHRAALMVARNEGMTKTYNRFHDPREAAAEIIQLRELHAQMDRAVLRAYRWNDLVERAKPQFLDETIEDDHTYQGRLFWPADFREEVLVRLLGLNAERAAEERALVGTPERRRARHRSSEVLEIEL